MYAGKGGGTPTQGETKMRKPSGKTALLASVLALNLSACTTNTGAPPAASGPIATGTTLAAADMAELSETSG